MWRWRCRSDRPPQPQRRGGSRLLACATGSTAVLLEAPYYYLQGSSASIAHSLRDTTRANPSANATDRYINTRATRAVPPIHNRSVYTSRSAWVIGRRAGSVLGGIRGGVLSVPPARPARRGPRRRHTPEARPPRTAGHAPQAQVAGGQDTPRRYPAAAHWAHSAFRERNAISNQP
jgi:hypothetical protein